MNNSELGSDLLFIGTRDFDILHSVALGSTGTGIICAITVIVLSYRSQSYNYFYTKWTRGQRFCVYVAVCDVFFNLFHGLDHSIVLQTKKHPTPAWFCSFLAFVTITPITLKYLLVFMIAFHTFASVVKEKFMDLGSRDWKFLLPCSVPVLASFILGILGYFGPAGYACFIKDPTVSTFAASVPQLLTLFSITLLYLITWVYILRKKRIFRDSSTWNQHTRQLIITAQRMTTSVCVFMIQFTPGGVVLILQAFADVPYWFFVLAIGFINAGGVYDCIVYCILKKNQPTTSSVAPAPQS